MTARATFGRKGMAGGDGGGMQSRRAAFRASERASADRTADTEVFATRDRVAPAEEPAAAAAETLPVAPRQPVGPRSLRMTYALWLVLGIAGAHRLYLGRIYSGALQAALCVGCLAATWMQYYQAFAGLALCWLWMFVDGIQLKKMHAEATAQAETFA